MKNFVAYYRVSMERPRKPSFDLEAQRALLTQHINDVHGAVVTAEFVEKESGKKNSRPKLIAAMSEANATAATLLVAKLEGLSRNAFFLRSLMDSKVTFACCDNPHVNVSTIGALAAMAGQESKLKSARIQEALKEKKARGERMGTPENLNEEARTKALAVRRQNAREAVEPVSDIIAEKRRMDWSYQQIADYLNDEEHTTPRGCQWTPIAVSRVSKIDKILSAMESDTETNDKQN